MVIKDKILRRPQRDSHLIYSPLSPKNEIFKFFETQEEKLNLELIGALPNKGIRQVRIHWLFYLILDR